MIDRCEREPSGRVTINQNGLLVVYAICLPHKESLMRRDYLAVAEDSNRGLVGPALVEGG